MFTSQDALSRQGKSERKMLGGGKPVAGVGLGLSAAASGAGGGGSAGAGKIK
jgi:hypothetical protein